MLQKKGAGIRITQPDSETIEVFEGEGSARILGIICILVGGFLMWTSLDNIVDITFIFGALLAVFGAAIATQRQTLTLDRRKGAWSCGGDVFFIIPFKSRGMLTEVGPVQVGRLVTNPTKEHGRGEPVITHPVSVTTRKIGGGTEELRFGKYWSIDEAFEIADKLAKFLDRQVQDDST